MFSFKARPCVGSCEPKAYPGCSVHQLFTKRQKFRLVQIEGIRRRQNKCGEFFFFF